ESAARPALRRRLPATSERRAGGDHGPRERVQSAHGSRGAALAGRRARSRPPVIRGRGVLAQRGRPGGRLGEVPIIREREDTVMTRHPTAEKAYALAREAFAAIGDRKSTRLNSSH